MCGARVDDLDLAAGGLLNAVHHGHGLARSVVVQAQDHQVHAGNQRALGGRILAQFGGNADQVDAGHSLQPFADLQTGGAGFAVNEHFEHGETPAIGTGLALQGLRKSQYMG
ncbi:hypothetical protein D3C71_1727570 [compost metagenome]